MSSKLYSLVRQPSDSQIFQYLNWCLWKYPPQLMYVDQYENSKYSKTRFLGWTEWERIWTEFLKLNESHLTKSPFNTVYIDSSQRTTSVLLFQVCKVLKLPDIEEMAEITASFHAVQNLLVLKHHIIGEQKVLCLIGFWINRPGPKVPNYKFSLKNLPETVLNWRTLSEQPAY
jgi:hypothetical protein